MGSAVPNLFQLLRHCATQRNKKQIHVEYPRLSLFFFSHLTNKNDEIKKTWSPPYTRENSPNPSGNEII